MIREIDPSLTCDVEYRTEIGDWLNRHELTGEAAEIGCLSGTFARQVLHTWKGYRYWMIDPWIAQSEEVYRERTEGTDYEQCFRECQQLSEQDSRVKLIRKFSVEASVEIENASLDFCYIDANHAYGPVMEDLDHWHPKLKVGGVMGLHDYGNDTNWPNFVEVKKAVDRWCSERRITFVYSRCNSVWYIKKW